MNIILAAASAKSYKNNMSDISVKIQFATSQLKAVIVKYEWKEKNNLSFPELQRQWSSQTLFQILTTDATIDACHMLLSLQKYKKTEQRFLQ